jgi:hypothetical protein
VPRATYAARGRATATDGRGRVRAHAGRPAAGCACPRRADSRPAPRRSVIPIQGRCSFQERGSPSRAVPRLSAHAGPFGACRARPKRGLPSGWASAPSPLRSASSANCRSGGALHALNGSDRRCFAAPGEPPGADPGIPQGLPFSPDVGSRTAGNTPFLVERQRRVGLAELPTCIRIDGHCRMPEPHIEHDRAGPHVKITNMTHGRVSGRRS